MGEATTDRVCQIVADVLGLPADQVTADTTHDTVTGWDSMAMINLLMAVEAEFSMALEAEDAAKLVSVAAVVDLVGERGGA
jgi:acyl carrier protein